MIDPTQKALAEKYNTHKLICRRCYARLSTTSKICRKCKSTDLRIKKKLK